MGLFNAQLYRSLALGFVLGGLLVAGVLGTGLLGGESLIAAATAAPADE
ncbi:hypothetical protein [Novosphingobium umbonatum]|jgi:hypothetical protein|nr:hypothetical protein [Novosphingobium umbonatum]